MCGCIEEVNEKLKSRNTELLVPWVFPTEANPNPPRRLLVEVTQIERGRGKAKAVSMFASCCPFCGVRYDG